MVYGIVVEGHDDKTVLPEMIKKCLSSNIEVISRIGGPKPKLIRIFPGFLEEFRYARQGAYLDKAIVICDSDNKAPYELLEKMKSKIANRRYPFEVKFIIIVQELETWLLADEEAISRVTQARSGRVVARVNEDLESIIQPKEKLQQILSNAGVPYTPEVAREIAKESDLSKIEYRCPSFRNFRQKVIDC